MIRIFPKLEDAPGEYAVYARRRLCGHLRYHEGYERVTLACTRTYYSCDTVFQRWWTVCWLDGTREAGKYTLKRAKTLLLGAWVQHRP